MLFLAGVYERAPDDTRPRFQWVRAPTSAQLAQLAHTIVRRVGRLLERKGLLERGTEQLNLGEAIDTDDPMPELVGHSITYRIAVGPHRGRKVFTLQTLPDNGWKDGPDEDNVDTHTSGKQANQPGDFGKWVAGIAGNTKLGCGLIKNRSICQIADTENLAFRPSGGNSLLQWSQPGLNNCAAAVWPLSPAHSPFLLLRRRQAPHLRRFVRSCILNVQASTPPVHSVVKHPIYGT